MWNEPNNSNNQDVQNDRVIFYFNPVTVNSFLGWGRFFAIAMMAWHVISFFSSVMIPLSVLTEVSYTFAAVPLFAIPACILGIIACTRLLGACKDIKSVIETGNPAFSDMAGENFGKSISMMLKTYIVSFIMSFVMIIAVVVLCIIFSDEIIELLKQYFESFGIDWDSTYGDMFNELPSGEEMAMQVKLLFGK